MDFTRFRLAWNSAFEDGFESAVFAVGTSALLFIVILVLSLKSTIWQEFDLKPLADAAASHNSGVTWYGGYHGQLNFVGGISYIHESRSREDLSEWLTGHRNGLLITRLSKANITQLKHAGIDASNSVPLSSTQMEQISEIVRADEEFPGHDWQPVVKQLYWIRRGLPLDPYAVVHFNDPPVACGKVGIGGLE